MEINPALFAQQRRPSFGNAKHLVYGVEKQIPGKGTAIARYLLEPHYGSKFNIAGCSDISQSLQLFLMYSLTAATFLRGLVIQAQSL
jgi:hypothetical protein